MKLNLFRRSDPVSIASKKLDEHRKANLAKLNRPHAVAARKGWERRRDEALL